MKLKKDEQRFLSHLKEHGSCSMTLGRGRPHDRRTVQSLIDKHAIKPVFCRSDVLQDEYAIREDDEDKHGLALFKTIDGSVFGATHYGVPVRPFTAEDYSKDQWGSALQNGIDTSLELYPRDEEDEEYDIRREYMQWAVARSTLAMND